jgi:myosin-5
MSSTLWWIPDAQEVWALARQVGEPNANGTLKLSVIGSDKQVTMNPQNLLETSITIEDALSTPNDLISLPEVNQASILSCTRSRFQKKQIYTSVGTVLMTVNPFERIQGLYGLPMIKKYENPFAEGGTLPPHVYLVPSRAFADMMRSGRDQSILISGESGAGWLAINVACIMLCMLGAWSLILELSFVDVVLILHFTPYWCSIYWCSIY